MSYIGISVKEAIKRLMFHGFCPQFNDLTFGGVVTNRRGIFVSSLIRFITDTQLAA